MALKIFLSCKRNQMFLTNNATGSFMFPIKKGQAPFCLVGKN